MNRIYLDYCASTPLHPEVREVMTAWLEQGSFGHASSVHQAGRDAENIVSRARTRVAALLEARPSEVVFTGSGTEANNLAIFGTAARAGEGARRRVITSKVEHESVLEPFRALERRGFDVVYLPVDTMGKVCLEALEESLTSETLLVSMMLANHEVGTLQPLREIVRLAHQFGALVHTDASIAIGRMPVSVQALGADLLTLSGHKIYGPQGTGALFVRRGLKLESQLVGGPHERKRRAGAENVLGLLGLGEAAEKMPSADLDTLKENTNALRKGLLDSTQGIRLNSPLDALPGILNVEFDGVEGESILMNLDLAGVCVSSGAPCSSGSLDPSPVLLAMGRSEAQARASVRFSPGLMTTRSEIDRVLEIVPGLVQRLRSLGHGGRRILASKRVS